MSGTFPSSPAFNSLNVSSVQPTFISRTISGRRQARQIGGQFWKMTATFPPMTRAEFAPIYAFSVSQRGRYESFSLVPPVLSSAQVIQSTSTAWQINNTATNVDQTSTSAPDGAGVKFTTVTNSTGVITSVTVTSAGTGYSASETITITDPGNTSNTTVVTISTVSGGGVTGLADSSPANVYTAPRVKGASQTGRSVITDSWNATALAMKAGDYIKFSNNDKVYMTTADSTADASGTATLAIEPALLTSPADNSNLTITSVPFNVALTSGVQEFSTGATGLFAYEIDFEEVI